MAGGRPNTHMVWLSLYVPVSVVAAIVAKNRDGNGLEAVIKVAGLVLGRRNTLKTFIRIFGGGYGNFGLSGSKGILHVPKPPLR